MQKISYLLSLGLFLWFSTKGLAQDCEKLVWADEFDGTELNADFWNYDIGNGCPELCGWGNNELQYYTNDSSNISVANGILTITAREDSMGGMDYSSARIMTKNKADFRYGRIEASMRLPQSQGLWPAFWLLPTDNVYGEWPRSGEIDIMELLGHKPNEVIGTLHTGLPWTFRGESFTLPGNETFADTFHVFSLEWEPDTMRWYVDDSLYHVMTSDSIMPWEPFHEDFFIIFNVAVGGNFPGNPDSTTVLPQVMEVDWVRVYNQPHQLRIQGEQPIIGQTGMRYHTFDIAGADYIWSVPAGSNIVSGQGTAQIELDWGCMAGDIMLEVQTDCDTVQISYAVPDFAKLQIAGVEVVEQNQTNLTYRIPEVDGGSYTWMVPGDVSIVSGQGTHEMTVDWGCSDGEIIISSNGNCGMSQDTLTVLLKEYAIAGFASVPINAVAQVYSIDPIPGATSNWSVPGDAMITGGQGTNSITVDFGSMDGDVSVEVSNTCGTTTYSIFVTIDPSAIYCDFDGTDLDWGGFSGSVFEKIPNPFPGGINTSGHVGKTRKDPGSQNWAGLFADLAGEMDLDANPYLHMKVYSEIDGIVKFKIEDQTTAAAPWEVDHNPDSLNQWVNLVFDFNGQATNTYDRIALFFDFGEVDTSYWYFDDVIGRSYVSVDIDGNPFSPILVYPNPTNDQLQIDLNENFQSGYPLKIRLFNTQGQVLLEESHSGLVQRLQMNLAPFPAGTYFLSIENQETRYMKPVVKSNP